MRLIFVSITEFVIHRRIPPSLILHTAYIKLTAKSMRIAIL